MKKIRKHMELNVDNYSIIHVFITEGKNPMVYIRDDSVFYDEEGDEIDPIMLKTTKAFDIYDWLLIVPLSELKKIR